jgi:hypothetical protein
MRVSAILNGVTGILLLVSASAFADSAQQVLSATSDAVQGTLNLKLVVDSDAVAQQFRTITAANKTTDYDVSQLASGVVLMNYQDHDVVLIKSTDFDPAHGGHLEVSYLNNGITGHYDSIDVDLERNGNQWQILSDGQGGHAVVTQAYFKAKKFFGKVIGIESITLK